MVDAAIPPHAMDASRSGDSAGGPSTALPQSDRCTVYYDGSCPLCRAEIAHYARQTGAEAFDFFDVSTVVPADGREETLIAPDLSRTDALKRFHVRLPNGALASGAAGFVEVWSRLRSWRWIGRIARFPGVLSVLEGAYRLFLPVRPVVSWIVSRVQRLSGQRRPR